MGISDTKTHQVFTLFIIIFIQLSPIVLTSPYLVGDTQTSLRNPISRQQHVHQVDPNHNHHHHHHHNHNHNPYSIQRPKQPQHPYPTEQLQQPQNPIPISNPSEQLQNPIPTLNPTEQLEQHQNTIPIPDPSQQSQNPIPTSNPTEQLQNTIPSLNPTEQLEQPQNPIPTLNPTEQLEQPQNQIPIPDPSQQPEQRQYSIPNPVLQRSSQNHDILQPLKDLFNDINSENQTPETYPENEAPRQSSTCSQLEVEEILSVHNNARVHESEPLYVWDEGLAEFARWWANKRIADCRVIHSYGPYGENIFWGLRDHWTIPNAIQSWVDEEKYYNKKTHVCQQGKLCGHYTQIVWRDSTKVGCARVNCTNERGIFITCNYDPPGNYANEDPFVPHVKT